MRLIVPYAALRPETRAALEADGREAEYVHVGGSPEAYHGLLESVWREGRGFILVEQDIVVWPGALAALEACPEPRCGMAYSLSTGYGSWLGCARFSDRLVADNPGVFQAIDALPFDGTPRRYWGRLDTRLDTVLAQQVGAPMHVHWPAVGHLNPAQQAPVLNMRCGHPVPDEIVQWGPEAQRAWTDRHLLLEASGVFGQESRARMAAS
jgi:hypothetical protein